MKSLTLFKIAVVLIIIGGYISKYNLDAFGWLFIVSCVVFLIGLYKFSKE